VSDFTEYIDSDGEIWHVGPDSYGYRRAWLADNLRLNSSEEARREAWKLSDAEDRFELKEINTTSDIEIRLQRIETAVQEIHYFLHNLKNEMNQ